MLLYTPHAARSMIDVNERKIFILIYELFIFIADLLTDLNVIDIFMNGYYFITLFSESSSEDVVIILVSKL